LPFKQYVTAYHSESGAGAMDLAAWSSNNSVVYYNTNLTVNDANWTLNSIDATGFTITTDATITPGTTEIS
jgi:predicted enzyme related to lactoylglutathione lyase